MASASPAATISWRYCSASARGADGLCLTLGVEDVALPPLGGENRRLLLALGPGDGGLPRPSASVTTARRVRSAFICSCMAFMTSVGGSIRWISTRTTRTPHLSVASSRICRRAALTRSREVNASSSVISPMTLRRLVCASLVTARMKFDTLYSSRCGSVGFEVDDGVDRHRHVVLGDDLLRRHVDDLLAHVDDPDALDEREDHPQAGVGGLLVFPQTVRRRLSGRGARSERRWPRRRG